MKKIQNLLVIGVGLIGGSLSLALKRNSGVSHVAGYGRNIESLDRAVELGVIDEVVSDLDEAVAKADIIFIAVPVKSLRAILMRISGSISSGAIITDGGSTKLEAITAARELLGPAFSRFVPGHPIAGSEKTGVDAAKSDLYDNHKVLLTPTEDTDSDAVEAVTTMWCDAGATVESMEARAHDRILGLTSHLPHILAFSLVDFISRGEDAERCFDLAAGGFIDFTRIASSDPVMWRDISISNRETLSVSLTRFISHLDSIKRLVEQGDGAGLETVLRHARDSRDSVIDRRAADK